MKKAQGEKGVVFTEKLLLNTWRGCWICAAGTYVCQKTDGALDTAKEPHSYRNSKPSLFLEKRAKRRNEGWGLQQFAAWKRHVDEPTWRRQQWLNACQTTWDQEQCTPCTSPRSKSHTFVAFFPKGPESHFPSLSQENPGPLPIKSQVNAIIEHRDLSRIALKFRERNICSHTW